jgi:hypothetical protein
VLAGLSCRGVCGSSWFVRAQDDHVRAYLLSETAEGKTNPSRLSHLLSNEWKQTAQNKPIEAIWLFINDLRLFWASFSKKMFGWSARPIKEFRSESAGERARVVPYNTQRLGDTVRAKSLQGKGPRNEPGMCPEISVIASSRFYQGSRARCLRGELKSRKPKTDQIRKWGDWKEEFGSHIPAFFRAILDAALRDLSDPRPVRGLRCARVFTAEYRSGGPE